MRINSSSKFVSIIFTDGNLQAMIESYNKTFANFADNQFT